MMMNDAWAPRLQECITNFSSGEVGEKIAEIHMVVSLLHNLRKREGGAAQIRACNLDGHASK
jgi:hypothetical protein